MCCAGVQAPGTSGQDHMDALLGKGGAGVQLYLQAEMCRGLQWRYGLVVAGCDARNMPVKVSLSHDHLNRIASGNSPEYIALYSVLVVSACINVCHICVARMLACLETCDLGRCCDFCEIESSLIGACIGDLHTLFETTSIDFQRDDQRAHTHTCRCCKFCRCRGTWLPRKAMPCLAARLAPVQKRSHPPLASASGKTLRVQPLKQSRQGSSQHRRQPRVRLQQARAYQGVGEQMQGE